jgi:hypothetical protein
LNAYLLLTPAGIVTLAPAVGFTPPHIAAASDHLSGIDFSVAVCVAETALAVGTLPYVVTVAEVGLEPVVEMPTVESLAGFSADVSFIWLSTIGPL